MRKVVFKTNFRRVSAEEQNKIRAEKQAKGERVTHLDYMTNDVKHGLFHQWGLESEEHEQNYGIYTVGIIEDETGQIHSVTANRIQFLK